MRTPVTVREEEELGDWSTLGWCGRVILGDVWLCPSRGLVDALPEPSHIRTSERLPPVRAFSRRADTTSEG